MLKLRRGINRILFLCAALHAIDATDTGYLATIDGVYSLGQKYLPDTAVSPYSYDPISYNFTDYGGRFLRTYGDWGVGFSSHLYSAFAGRATGNYRVALGWVQVQLRVRKTWLDGLLFA